MSKDQLSAFTSFMHNVGRAFNGAKSRVSVGTVVLPLHIPRHKSAPSQRMLHHMAMQEMAGHNHLGSPRGFRIAPTSRKNPATHAPGPQTRVECLARDARRAGEMA
jgi:hypothetical protein